MIFCFADFFFYPIFSSLPFILIICCRRFVRLYDFAFCLSLRFLFAFTFSQVVEIQLSPYSRLRYDAHSHVSTASCFYYFVFFCSAMGVSKNSFPESGHALLTKYSSPMLASTVCRTPKIVLFSTTIEIRIFVLLNILRPRLFFHFSFFIFTTF